MMKTKLLFLAIQATLVASLVQSHMSLAAEVEFLSGGYADQCAQAADKAGEIQRLPVTGSNLELDVVAICTRAIEGWDGVVSDVAESYNNRGVLYFAKADYVSALADFDAAIAKKPLLAQAHINRGYTLAALQRWQDSINAIKAGLDLGAEEQAMVYFSLGISHEELGEVRQAYLDYLRAVELDPLWTEPREELTRFNIRQH